jgi:hypothetical protein
MNSLLVPIGIAVHSCVLANLSLDALGLSLLWRPPPSCLRTFQGYCRAEITLSAICLQFHPASAKLLLPKHSAPKYLLSSSLQVLFPYLEQRQG